MREAFQEWESKHEDKKGEEIVTESGIPLKRVYTPLDLEEKGFDYMRDIGLPGEFPFTRGVSAETYREKPPIVEQYAGRPSTKESGKLWKLQIEAGAGQILIAYDLATQMGYDPDHPMAEGDVGRIGVSMVSLRDWEKAFKDIEVRKIRVSQVLNASAIVGLANHICLAEEQAGGHLNYEDVRGYLQNDILKEFMARGCYIFPPAESVRLAVDILYYAGRYLPNYDAMTVCTFHQSEKGASPVQAVIMGMAEVATYVQEAVNRGMDVDTIAPTIAFLHANHSFSFWEEIAKHRAMRRMYAKMMKERFKAKKPESMTVRSHTGEGGTDHYKEQYLNNITRAVMASLAAILGGAQIISQRPYDEVYGIATDNALLTAMRSVQVLVHETGVGDVLDPLGGSYYVEWLTSEFEERAYKGLEEVEKRGGVIPCIETGYFHRMMEDGAYKWQKKIESGETLRVGVNCFKSAEVERPVTVYRADPKVELSRKREIIEFK